MTVIETGFVDLAPARGHITVIKTGSVDSMTEEKELAGSPAGKAIAPDAGP